MGDSDDEYDRKRRDKFRGERAEASYRGTERSVRPRDDWQERDVWSRPRPREYRGAMRDRGYSPSFEPPAKRIRQDYYGDPYYNHYQPYHQPIHREPPASPAVPESQQPVMMSFKAFLAAQDDNISDSEAVEKYNEYKLEFHRQQLNEFFVAHKDDEWFRTKYHPEDSVKRKDELKNALKRRVDVFVDLMDSDNIEKVSIDHNRTNDLLKLLDTVVIKLEGGTDEDIEALDQEYIEKPVEQKQEVVEKKEEPVSETVGKEEGEIDTETKTSAPEEQSKINGDAEETDDIDKLSKEEDKDDEEVQNSEPAARAEEEEDETSKDEAKELQEEEKMETNEDVEDAPETASPDKKRKRSYSQSSSSSSSSSSQSEEEEEEEKAAKPLKPKDDEPKKETEVKEIGGKQQEVVKIQVEDDVKSEKPKSLHKTTSIFLRNLAPTITKQEVEAICARYDGFLRVALSDPQPERRWMRRGWVTFKRNANIKEICWNFNNIRLRDCELGAIVNRDLSRRIRLVNGITAHKQVVRSDIRISARVVMHLDGRAGLWTDEDDEKKGKSGQTFGFVSNNPVLHNITDYLIEEASAEEEELLGLESTAGTDKSQEGSQIVDRDDVLVTVLDKIILYLRIVHSVDYYNHCEYPNEDEMPNRCGILHARGPAPTTKTDLSQFLGVPIEQKMIQFLPEKVNPEENKNETKLISLSLKDVDTEIDKFVQANTRELAKDKWLCPLSGKKFKGPDFVRKHIFNKHAEKIEEVKKEVEFFNNYLRDPKRPMLELPQQKREEPANFGGHSGSNVPARNYGGSFGGGGYGAPPRFYNQGFSRMRYSVPRARGGNTGTDFRPIIHYRDLDAPREPEEFI